MEIELPEHVEGVLKRLEKYDYKAYVVGGSIRDILLGKDPDDFDIATDATPDEVERIYNDISTTNIGKKFGTIIIHLEEGDVEVTTFRTEGSYLDGRKPEWVEFVPSIEDDLKRRDFTINAIAYNKDTGIVDPYGGVKSLNKKRIVTVGKPEDRFSEDYLRIMRAIRFASTLDFKIDKETLRAGKRLSKNITRISTERITQEFFKILLSDNPARGINLMKDLGLLEEILPELNPTIGFKQYNPHHSMDVYNHILCVVENSPRVLSVRLAALFHDIAKPLTFSLDEDGIGRFYGHDKLGAEITEKILKRFKCPNNLISEVSNLVKEHMIHHNKLSDKGLKRLIRRVGKENIFKLFALQKADRKCSSIDTSVAGIVNLEKRVKKILSRKEAFDLRHLKIDGNDLISLGYEEGKIIGEILESLLEVVIDDPSENKKDQLIKIALKNYPISE